jgi:hypothetical protein
MNAIPSFVSGVTIGPPRVFDRLTLYPLSHSQNAQLPYSTLDDAISSETLRICEVSLEGQVAQVSASLASSGSRAASQTEIWQNISEKCKRMGAVLPGRLEQRRSSYPYIPPLLSGLKDGPNSRRQR